MMLKRSTHESQPKRSASASSSRLVRAGLAGLAALSAVAGLATGCLDRPVVKATPTTSNVFVDQIVQTAVDKIDLLFMLDNSVSMADKQAILQAAVPVLLGRLVTPICVDTNGNPTSGSETTAGACAAAGFSPEFAPINDIHIGIVTSSLGSHGGTVCSMPTAEEMHVNDNGELMGIQRSGLTTWAGSGFLAWDPDAKDTPPGESNAANLNTNFAAMVKATGQDGCGFESQLEGWYRFLIDPEPPADVVKANGVTVRGSQLVTNTDGTTTCMGCDTNLLAQRKAFLRPDSLVAVVMLSDENDCSIRDDGVGWFVGTTSPMPEATQVCATNPNDPCCRSCAQNETSPPSGCAALSADPVCMGAAAGSYNTYASKDDSLNLRCFNQKQRFGFDLLYPTSRYVTGLTSPTLTLQSDGKTTVVNPLYDVGTSGKPPRDPSLVFLAGIVGVPWQDLASADTLTDPAQLTYLTATELAAPDANGNNRWTQLLGNAAASPPVAPSDPYMVESILPRTGQNPNSGDALAPDTSMNPQASKINGHEQNIVDNADLQFACIAQLTTSKVCQPGDIACDCSGTVTTPATATGDLSLVTSYNSPLCQPPGGGAVGATQYYFKAYPGARELTVLRDYGANAIVASICPKINDTTSSSYGYNPAVAAIINRLKDALKGKCLPRAIQKNPDGTVECEVIEAQKAGNCDCTLPGRAPADPAIYSAVFNQLSASNTCGNPGQAPCDTTGFCMCEITQETGADLATCEADGTPMDAGYCYIDDPNSPALKNCPDNQKRLLNFVNSSDGKTKTPAQGAIAFIACLGAPIDSTDGG